MGNTGDSIRAENASWNFAGEVSQNFDTHVSKSVPLYDKGHDLVIKISDFFLKDGSTCYELGCSTGTLTQSLVQHNKNKKIKLIAVDQEQDMVDQAKDKCKDLDGVSVVASDIMDLELEKSDLIVAYYTMQFIDPKNRQIIFDRIFEALNWGGAFVLFEKVRGPDARFQDMMTQLYTEYKLDQGYNSEEIISKARSLKGVLEPFSTQGNIDLLKRAGFSDIMTVMKYMCFEGFLAIK